MSADRPDDDKIEEALERFDDAEVDHDLDWSGEIVTITARRTGTGDRSKVYHTDDNCRFSDSNSAFPWPRDGAEEWGYVECSRCAGNFDKQGCGNDHTEALVEIGEMIDDPSEFTIDEMVDLYNERKGGSA